MGPPSKIITLTDRQETCFGAECVSDVCKPNKNVIEDENASSQRRHVRDDRSNTQIPLVDNSPLHVPADDHAGSHIPKAQPTKTTSTGSNRVLAPDILRGFIMAVQAYDHAAIVNAYHSHGQAILSENASTRVTEWNSPVYYTLRIVTHLCAPGFIFLLGMGIVYVGRSRSKLGWTSLRMARYFFLRAMFIALLSWIYSFFTIKKLFPLLNAVLLASAFNYFFAGTIWLAIYCTEPRLANQVARALLNTSAKNPESRSLLQNELTTSPSQDIQETATRISFHVHNTILLIFAIVTVWWNIWFDPSQGRCLDPSVSPPARSRNAVFEFFFHVIRNDFLFSLFPPLAWSSAAILGIIYGRIVLSHPWRAVTINIANLVLSNIFTLLFVLTRLLHLGNLDEDCLFMSEHIRNPAGNQYLASIRSFFYITKYPPSPSYMSFTFAGIFLILGVSGFVSVKMVKYFPLSTLLAYSRSPLLFYMLHYPLYGLLGVLLQRLFGNETDVDDQNPYGHPAWGPGSPLLFWTKYIVGLLILWPTCHAYARFKATKGPDSLWRFL